MMFRFIKLLCLSSAFFVTSAFSSGATEYYFDDEINDQVMCVGYVTQNCINVICLTSNSRECQEDCETMALKKCNVIGTVQTERVFTNIKQ